MNPRRKLLNAVTQRLLAMVCGFSLLPGDTLACTATFRATQATSPSSEAVKLTPDQLDSLVAPIALYPDGLLAQTLVVSTYPLELIQLQQWLARNPGLKDQALADAVAKGIPASRPWPVCRM